MPSMLTVTVSPATIGPTPAGVPVRMTSPGSSVITADTYSFCPLGPWIETELDPSATRVTTRVDGEVKQDGPTSDMIHDVAQLISHASQAFTLLPGDVILTGTPEGVGQVRAGQRVEVEIPEIGVLANTYVADEDDA